MSTEHYGSIKPALKNIATHYVKGLETLIRLLGSSLITGLLIMMVSTLAFLILILPLRFYDVIDRESGHEWILLAVITGALSPFIIRFSLSATGFSHPSKLGN